METKGSIINREMGKQLKREQAVAPYSVRELAERTGVSESVINRMWGKDPRDINITQITWLAALMGTTPQELVAQAVTKAGGLGAIMDDMRRMVESDKAERARADRERLSAGAATTDDLTTHRLQKEAAAMSAAEIEDIAIAATEDAERRTDEPPAP